MVGIVEYAVLLILHFLLQAFPPLLTHHVFLSVLDINSVGGGLGFNALEVYPCGIVRIFHVQRYKMKIVQYCKMLRKLAISYDSGPIILLPFYLFTFLPFYLFTFPQGIHRIRGRRRSRASIGRLRYEGRAPGW